MSNVRVSVEWDKTAVYAGENIGCVITFKNVAQTPKSQRTASQTGTHNSPRERWKDHSPMQVRQQEPDHSRRYSSSSTVSTKHRKALSRDPGWSTIPAASSLKVGKEPYNEQGPTSRRHRRSVSIVSMGGEKSSSGKPSQTISTPKRRSQGHGRAASLQVLSGKDLVSDCSTRSTTHRKGSSVHAKGSGQTVNYNAVNTIPALLGSAASPMVKQRLHLQRQCNSDQSMAVPISSKSQTQTAFPSAISSIESLQSPRSLDLSAKVDDVCTTDNLGISLASTRYTRQEHPGGKLPEIVSPTSNNDTPRRSTDLYSFSSNSSDTLASEYVITEHSRFLRHPVSGRQQSHLTPSEVSQHPETLMMGYGNIVGSFCLDPSLVDAGCFDEVKRKGVVGNQGGGGVVRTESTKRQSGLLGSLGWNAIGESLEGLLGRREVSSIKEAPNTSAVKWMPILWTPQSLLFVDLRLEPGQSQSYAYSFRLPAGLPPSYRGKAVRFSYNIVIGVQRATRSRQRHIVRQIDFPFRVLPSINEQGQTMGHDLMSPHVMLNNEPSISALDRDNDKGAFSSEEFLESGNVSAEDAFLSYMKQLLDTSRRNSSLGLLSPSAVGAKSPLEGRNGSTTMESAISSVIQQSNSVMPSKLSANRFELARSGLRVAAIMLARPAYRLGEMIPVVVDLHASELQCFSLRVSLETSEHVDPTIALRSPASILRASRRIYATQHETTISADRVFVNLAVPSNATPEFMTSGVSLQWRLRFEFVTSNQADRGTVGHGAISDILEEAVEDERGTVSVAVEALPCETFEVTLPLHIYGAISALKDNYVHGPKCFGTALI